MKKLLVKSKAEEVYQILEFILKILSSLTWENNAFMAKLIEQLTEVYSGLTRSLSAESKNKFTELLRKKDDIRDGWWVGIGYYLRGAIHFDGEIGKSASILYDIYQSEGEAVHKQSYEMETSSINVVLEKLNDDKNKEHRERLRGLNEYLTVLEKLNTEFFDLYAERGVQEAVEKEIIPVNKQNREAQNLINQQLLPFLELMSATHPEEYGVIEKMITEYIDDINTKVRARETRSRNKGKIVEE